MKGIFAALLVMATAVVAMPETKVHDSSPPSMVAGYYDMQAAMVPQATGMVPNQMATTTYATKGVSQTAFTERTGVTSNAYLATLPRSVGDRWRLRHRNARRELARLDGLMATSRCTSSYTSDMRIEVKDHADSSRGSRPQLALG